jgi:aminoglycoside phosphotransferase (APT) family kinase protein
VWHDGGTVTFDRARRYLIARLLPNGQHGPVSERIHDDELDTSEETVRAVLSAQCRQWAELPITYLRTGGTDNAMWRVHLPRGGDVVVRLPRRRDTAEAFGRELELLCLISESPLTSVVSTPPVRHLGEPHEAFPHRWAVLGWLDGSDAWSARTTLDGKLEWLATDLAEVVLAIGRLVDVPAPQREPGRRGGPLAPLLRDLHRWLDDPQWGASELIDVAAVKRLADEGLEVAEEPVAPRLVHGDLIPGNLLIDAGRLKAVIDWSCAAYADPAQDLAPAWSVLDERSRQVFRQAVDVDDATWVRARTFELQHAVAGVLYYLPRHHTLGDVMARTLGRILEER